MLSSRTRGWKGTVVELFRYQDVDALVQSADHEVAVHLAGSVMLHRCRRGRCRARAMSPGDVTITPLGSPVHWRQAGQSLVIAVHLDAGFVAEVAARECDLDLAHIVIQDAFGARDPKLEQLALRLLAALELEGAAGTLCADAASWDLATHFIRNYSGVASVRVREPGLPGLSPHKLRRVEQFINENLRNRLTLAAMADVVALSPGHFAHAFRHATGVSPHRYVLSRRVERAKELLRNSDLTITEIANASGCSSHSHFSVLFHRVAGVSPREYRQRG
jgi:AraC family transcriptional regulator